MAESGRVQLLSMWASPFVMRVQVALALKGVEYETVPQDLRDKSELLVQANPVYKKVPVLLHDGKAVCESMVIVQYVDETWPSPSGVDLLPADSYGRAMARFWADFVDKRMEGEMRGVLRANVKGSREEKQAAGEKLVAALSALEAALVGGGGPFFGGRQMGLVDVAVAPLVVWMPAVEEMAQLSIPWAEKLPRLQAAMAAMRSHPAAAQFPQPSQIKDFISRIIYPQMNFA